MTDIVDMNEFMAGYLVEVEEHLGASTKNILAVEAALRKGDSNPKAVRELFRALHTIKGLSAMVGVEPIVDIAHSMETVLREADRAAGVVPPAAIEVLLRGLRAIEERTRALSTDQQVAPAPPALLDALSSLEPAAAPSMAAQALDIEPELFAKLTPGEKAQLARGTASGQRALRIDFVPSPARAAEGINITSIRERLGRLGEIIKVVPVSVPPSEAAPGGLAFVLLVLTSASRDEIAAAAPLDSVRPLVVSSSLPLPTLAEDAREEFVDYEPQRRGVVRVEVARLDDAIDKLSALVVTKFRLSRALEAQRARGVDVRDLAEIVREYGQQLRDLRGAIMRARMIPVTELLERVPLIVRGLGRTTGKQVRLEINTGKAELDKAVAERIFPAIVHLLRNAVDHAIELPEERRRLGKPEEGVIKVNCFERSNNQLELSITDDGRGIDREGVARRAGRPAPETDAALLELITLPGLSTSEQATTISGRGLGMDIVKRIAVDQLGGELSVSTEGGVGTTFVIRIPLTITIVDAFSLLCGKQPFVTPVAGVEEVIDVDQTRFVGGLSARARCPMRLLERRGEAVPIFDLAALFNLGTQARVKALVVRRNGAPLAFGVDRVVGQQEVVVRPLEDPLVRIPGISGSTDLGDGQPTLVLDLIALGGTLFPGRREVTA